MKPAAGFRPYGRHLLLDLAEVRPEMLQDAVALEAILREAAEIAGASALGAQFHHFGAGAGVTGVVLLQESHISIHTWPEHRFAAVDVFMCGAARPELAADHVVARLAPAHHSLRSLPRGEG